MWDAVVISGLPEGQQSKANKHLANAFEAAYMSAPYGTHEAETPGMAMVMDFVQGWMQNFINRAWNVLEEGVSTEKEEQYAFLTTLFQYLTDPEQCCLPLELVSINGAKPPENWGFIAELAMAVLNQEDPAPKKKKRKTNQALNLEDGVEVPEEVLAW